MLSCNDACIFPFLGSLGIDAMIIIALDEECIAVAIAGLLSLLEACHCKI